VIDALSGPAPRTESDLAALARRLQPFHELTVDHDMMTRM